MFEPTLVSDPDLASAPIRDELDRVDLHGDEQLDAVSCRVHALADRTP